MTFAFTWRWPWLLLAGLIVFIVIAGLTVLSVSRKNTQARQSGNPVSANTMNDPNAAVVWHLEEDLQTEQASSLWKRWRLLNRCAITALIVIALGTVAVMARPTHVDGESSTSSTRDIILCLDVSGSTLPYDREVIATYRDLVQHFQGERIGLSIFNSTSRTVFPLTDDYDLVEQQLSHAEEILKDVVDQASIDQMTDEQYQDIADWLEGTQNRKDVTSLIGDGLVSCAAMLPEFSENDASNDKASASETSPDRAASIVLATDNVLSGEPLYQLNEALSLTQQSNIVVDGLYSGAKETNNDKNAQEMKTQIESHGGVFLQQSSNTTVNALVRKIEDQHTKENE